jgi:two-component system cell cycle response regulator DivK
MAHERILIVEDHEKNRRLVRNVLRFTGYETVESETAEDGYGSRGRCVRP